VTKVGRSEWKEKPREDEIKLELAQLVEEIKALRVI
jgi:hypothetical protein